jgi:hypothetical protein
VDIITLTGDFFVDTDVSKDIYVQDWVYTIQQVLSASSVLVSVRTEGREEINSKYYSDWGITTNTVNNLPPNNTFFVCANGKTLGYFTSDAGGNLSLTDEYINIQVGDRFLGLIRTMPHDFGEGIHTDGMHISANSISFRVLSDYPFKFGKSLGHLTSWAADNSVRQVAAEQGDFISTSIIEGSGRTDQIYVVQDMPQPTIILSIGFLANVSIG